MLVCRLHAWPSSCWRRVAGWLSDPVALAGIRRPEDQKQPVAFSMRPAQSHARSTHGQLHSQLTVNSQSTRQSTHSQLNSQLNGQRDRQVLDLHCKLWKTAATRTARKLFNLIKIIKRGRSPHPSSLSGLMTTPLLQLRNVNPGFGCPVDR